MNKIPYKVRVGIAVGLFIWSILAVIMTIVFSQYHFELWVVIVVPILAVLSFILSIIFMPRTKEGEEEKVVKPAPSKHRPQKQKKHKKSFISEKEWEELEEEDEECLYISDSTDD